MKKFRDSAEEMHAYHAIKEKLRHQLRHPGRALDLKTKDLIGHLWVSLIIDQSECLLCFLFLHWINSFLQCNCTALNQSEWRNFFMYIIKKKTTDAYIYIDCGSFVLTKTCMKTGAKGLFAIGSLLYISYSKNKTTILWLVDGSKSGCCRSISCNQKQQQQNDTEIVAWEQPFIILSWQLIVRLSGLLRRTVFLVFIDFWQPVRKCRSHLQSQVMQSVAGIIML